ncbi:MAG: peptidylprolyl isomerase, partial [Ignavibacteriales bacterium]|nr:peptidylprolyl isomerase [Ignavibacteriales bacterium]
AYDRALADPQNRAAWVEVEKRLREQFKQQKLQSLLLATVRVTEPEIRQRFSERAVIMEALYALFDPSVMVPDSMVVVTENEIERYYRENQAEFKVRPTRRLNYVIFSTAPSAQDTLDVVAELERLKEQALEGADFLELAKSYSEIPATKAYYKPGELSQAKADVFSAQVGTVLGPIRDFDGYHLMKVSDVRRGSETYVRAAHILFPVEGDTASALRQAREVLQRIRAGEDFVALARQHGTDGSAPDGGDLGWGNKTTWVKPFGDVAFGAKVGEVVGPVRTQFGIHLIKILDRSNREVELIDLAMRVKTSSQSIDAAYQRAQDFVYLAGEEGFENAAKNSSVQIRETPEFMKGGVIPQIGFNDAVMSFAFSGSMGKVSEPIGISGGVGVFRISAIREEGVRPLADVKTITRSMVIRKKKMERIAERAKAFHAGIPLSGGLRAAAKSFPDVTVRSTGLFKAGEPPSGVGRDLSFIGVAESLNPGQISKPFEGSRGYYVLEMLSKVPFDSTLYAAQRNDLMQELYQEKRSRLSQDWVAVLRERADIEDYRDRFFR